MSLYENKLLIIGFQVSLILHLLIFILLQLLPIRVLDFPLNQPIEIKLEEEEIKKTVEKKVQVHQKSIESKEEKKLVSPDRKVTNKPKSQEVKEKQPVVSKQAVINSQEATIKHQVKSSNPDILKIDDENLKLLGQLQSVSSGKKESAASNQEISFGESLSKIDSSVSGTGSSRSVIYKPNPPKITTSETLPSVKVKIWINPDGSVSKVELLTTTGDPEVNSTVISYMKRWKFNKISSTELQWAIVTIRFNN
ncbi:TonB family C- domain protein [Sulfurihydrogenibium azorense Az-Fu1]|uniref:TonB family C-domain protein n=1 Tax=Sulfurihydrogenibium azorense (strain DSM 15241 / OCM 825 / Az-Fu1) TaxID=204536 RepID=C1DU04_SULAA|nr:TonB family protein [Sulfurihydrogenibium azorense]ACN99031.1 TonB family C- domain protein [Sulfurihydrogenibium azorense Az-Fu1]